MDGAFRKRAAIGCAVFVLGLTALAVVFKESPMVWQVLLYETLPFYGYADEDSHKITTPARTERPEETPAPEPEPEPDLDVA